MEIDSVIDLKPADRKLLSQLFLTHLKDTTVWAFGSRIHAIANPHSDLDLVAFTAKKTKASELKEALEDSSITIRIDLHIWSELPTKFQENIRSSYVLFQ